MSFLRNILKVENTPEILWCVGVLIFFALAILSVLVLHHVWSATDYGAGLGSTLAGGGIGAWFHRQSFSGQK